MKMTGFFNLKRAFVVFAFAKAILLATSCNTNTYALTKVAATQTEVDSTAAAVTSINDYIAPYKQRVDQEMNSPLTYNPTSMTKSDYKHNTPIGNMMADLMYQQAAPVYKQLTGKNIDVALLNNGGIRAGLPAGPVTMRNAFEIMPFENEMLVATMDGNRMQALIDYLVEENRAHPLHGMTITLKSDRELESVLINGKPLDKNANYQVLTNDYLYSGGDNMNFFKDAPAVVLDYKLRNALIDAWKKIDTLKYSRDNRFTIK